MMTYPTTVLDPEQPALKARISTVSFGPCFCRSVAGSDGSFDVFRHRSVEAPLQRDILIVSNRVPSSGVATVRRLHAQLSDPIVIATAACPSTGWYWERSKADWVTVADLVDVDHHLDACLTGQPEALFPTLLAVSGSTSGGLGVSALTEAV